MNLFAWLHSFWTLVIPGLLENESLTWREKREIFWGLYKAIVIKMRAKCMNWVLLLRVQLTTARLLSLPLSLFLPLISGRILKRRLSWCVEWILDFAKFHVTVKCFRFLTLQRWNFELSTLSLLWSSLVFLVFYILSVSDRNRSWREGFNVKNSVESRSNFVATVSLRIFSLAHTRLFLFVF